MFSHVLLRRRKLAMLQHERVMEEAEFVAQLGRQARNRAAAEATPVYADRAVHIDAVRQRVEWDLVSN